MTSTHLAPNPYQRIDALEVIVRQQQVQIAQLASGLAVQAAAHVALCAALGQSMDALPGESPVAPEPNKVPEHRKGKH